MKSILISIKPKYVADILSGRKTIEIRKTMPKCDLPIDVYIYCTKEEDIVRIGRLGGDEFIRERYPLTENQFKSMKSGYSAKGKVVAKFTLNKVEEFTNDELLERLFKTDLLIHKSCVSFPQLMAYSCASSIYAWHIDNLEIFDKPKELSEFYCRKYLKRPPESWCYVEVEK